MKPFNLQEALAGKPVVTREGLQVQDLQQFPSATYQRIGAVIRGEVLTFNENGGYWNNGNISDRDLCMASEKKEGWVNVYPKVSETSLTRSRDGYIYESKALANDMAGENRIACVRVEWEE
jgi:hypothetical protein